MKKITILFIVLLVSKTSISQDVQLQAFRQLKMSKKDSTSLITAWNKLYTAAKNKDRRLLDSICLNQIDCSICDSGRYMEADHKVVSIGEFLVGFQQKHTEMSFSKLLTDSSYNEIKTTLFPEKEPDNFKLGKREKLIEYEINFHYLNRSRKYHEYYCFIFVKRNNQYKFSGLITY